MVSVVATVKRYTISMNNDHSREAIAGEKKKIIERIHTIWKQFAEGGGRGRIGKRGGSAGGRGKEKLIND